MTGQQPLTAAETARLALLAERAQAQRRVLFLPLPGGGGVVVYPDGHTRRVDAGFQHKLLAYARRKNRREGGNEGPRVRTFHRRPKDEEGQGP